MYRLKWPFARFFASLGFSLSIKINVVFDEEANVYVATSNDLKGLVVEAETLDELKQEVALLIPEMISLNMPNLKGVKTPTFPLFERSRLLHP